MSEYITVGKAWETQNKGVVVQTTRPPVDHLSDMVSVIWQDQRLISPEQRRKAYALMGEISVWSGMRTDEIKLTMKHDFLNRHIERLHKELFSLADCDMTTARDFISYLIDFMLEFDVPSRQPLYDLCDDIPRYVYGCLMQRKCAVCGRKADLHHVEKIGMGRNRNEICHIGMQALPLCREHHMEAHLHGDAALMDKYHLESIPIDEKIAKKYKLGGRKQ